MPQVPKGPWGSFHVHLSQFQVTNNIFLEEFPQLLLYKRNALATFLGQVRHFKMASDLPQNGKNVGMLVFEKQWLQLSLGHS